MAARLSPEEREARRKARSAHSFSRAAYRHYDPRTEGYGSPDDWIAAAEALISGTAIFKKNAPAENPDLATLYLTEFPDDIAGLKKAFRNTLFIVHPDYGGTNEATRAALAAFERLAKFYR